jgi:hypothetical protein
LVFNEDDAAVFGVEGGEHAIFGEVDG